MPSRQLKAALIQELRANNIYPAECKDLLHGVDAGAWDQIWKLLGDVAGHVELAYLRGKDSLSAWKTRPTEAGWWVSCNTGEEGFTDWSVSYYSSPLDDSIAAKDWYYGPIGMPP